MTWQVPVTRLRTVPGPPDRYGEPGPGGVVETELPAVGLMKVRDAETGQERWIDSSSKRVREAYRTWWDKRQAEMNAAFQKSRIDAVSIRTEDDYVKALLTLFDKRN